MRSAGPFEGLTSNAADSRKSTAASRWATSRNVGDSVCRAVASAMSRFVASSLHAAHRMTRRSACPYRSRSNPAKRISIDMESMMKVGPSGKRWSPASPLADRSTAVCMAAEWSAAYGMKGGSVLNENFAIEESKQPACAGHERDYG